MMRLADYIARNYSGKVVEVGVGRYWDVAIALSQNFEVVVTDVKDVGEALERVKFVVDDITNPDMSVYAGASLIYSIRPPPEIFDAIRKVAEAVAADAIIKPIHNEFPDRRWRLVNFDGLSFYVVKGKRTHENRDR